MTSGRRWFISRTREIGIRAALGASRLAVVRDVLRRELAVVFAGVAAGVLLSLGATRLVAGLLYDVDANDATTLALAAACTLATAALAVLVPAIRAARIDAKRALAEE